MKRFNDLSDVLEHIWVYVLSAVQERDNAMTTPVFATGGPGARTVALRRCDRGKRTFLFHTDQRSQKVLQIASNPRAIWVAWDGDLSQQFQFFGKTTVHVDDDVADELWAKESEDNLQFYYKAVTPGEVLDAPKKCIGEERVTESEARENFSAVRTVVDEIVWLHLHPEVEYRARFRWTGDRFCGEWIVP